MVLRYIFQMLMLLWFVSIPTMTAAETIIREVQPGILASAEYEAGESDMPVVLIVHGFLQNNNYLTLTNIKDAVLDNGYSLLAPVISLSVNNRRSSLPCQSTHRHTMEDSLNEIESWMQWLKEKKHNRVILIGHSFGSVQAVAYVEKKHKANSLPRVTKIIGVSLIDSEYVPDRERREQLRITARQRLQNNNTETNTYRLSYCHIYRASAKGFLSYADWTSDRILAALQVLTKDYEVVSILGSKDKRVPINWPDKQKNAGAEVKLIEGANHFFGGSQQIDLIEYLDELLGDPS